MLEELADYRRTAERIAAGEITDDGETAEGESA
jgi:hypothetical protein